MPASGRNIASALGFLAIAALTSGDASALEFIVDRVDGEVFIKNSEPTVQVFDGYSIFSPGDALDVGGWTPITGNYDLSGDQSVDPTANWFLLGVPSSQNVAEASTVSGSGSLDPGQIVSLGLFFDTSKLEGLVVTTSAGTVTSDPFPADFRTLTADYDDDLDVDLDDYAVFASTYGGIVDLRADGNGDGVVNAADYTVWRDSPELSLNVALIAGPSSPLASTVPEPSGGVLAAGVLGLAGVSSGRRRRAAAPW